MHFVLTKGWKFPLGFRNIHHLLIGIWQFPTDSPNKNASGSGCARGLWNSLVELPCHADMVVHEAIKILNYSHLNMNMRMQSHEVRNSLFKSLDPHGPLMQIRQPLSLYNEKYEAILSFSGNTREEGLDIENWPRWPALVWNSMDHLCNVASPGPRC